MMDYGKVLELSGLEIPERATTPAIEYMFENLRLADFTAFLWHLQVFARKHWKLLREDYFDLSGTSDLWEYVVQTQGYEGFRRHTSLSSHLELVSEMLLCRTVDNFLKYLVDLLATVFKARPETLRSEETVTLEFVLRYSDMDELINTVAEDRIERLSYLGTRKLASFFADRLGFDLFESDDEMNRTIRVVELRNIIVHNRGVVSKTFKRRVPDYPADENERIALDYGATQDERRFLNNLVFHIDPRAATKWDLPTFPLGPDNSATTNSDNVNA